VFSPGIWWMGSSVNLSGCWGPEFADGFIGCKAAEGVESSGEVVGGDEVGQVRFELLVRVVEEAFDGGFLDGSVHSFDLTLGPGMVRLGEAVFDSVDMAGSIEGMAAEAGGGPWRFFGRSANWIPLSVSTVWMR
jgi:hypothetical protein